MITFFLLIWKNDPICDSKSGIWSNPWVVWSVAPLVNTGCEIYVRVLSLRSNVIHGFVTEPWYSHHVRVFMWARGFECARVARSLVCVPCFMLERGVWIPALMFWVSVTWRGSDTRAPFSVICVSARSRVRSAPRTLVHVCFVVLHAVCVSIGCVHLCCHVLCEHVAYEFSH